MSEPPSSEMTAERWRRLGELFDRASELEPAAREAFLKESCEDAELRQEVLALLAADDHPAEYLDLGAAHLVAEVWSEDGESSARPGPGRRCGNYELIEEIGRGGMSQVFLARRSDDRLAHRVAVKVLKTAGWNREELERRFLAEGLVLSSFSHPNIAQVFDAGIDEQGFPFLVMEHIEGESITEHCRTRSLGIERRLDLFREVCAAVQHAHQRLVVHRDIKPSNILVDGDGRVKLLDFGIAKLLDPTAGDLQLEAPLTRTGLLAMTPEYAAPEQLQAREITTATDVYALGLLLYELLTVQRPFRFEERTAAEIERVVCYQAPLKPSTTVARSEELPRATRARLRDRLRGDLDTIVLKALRKEPEARYVSAQALAEDLLRFQKGQPIEARDPSAAYLASKFARRNRLPLAAAALVSLSLLGGLAVSLDQTRRARRAQSQAQAINRFLVEDLLGAAQPEVARGREVTVREVLEGAEHSLVGALDDQPEVEVALRRVLSSVYRQLADVELAQRQLDEADRSLRAAGSGELDRLLNQIERAELALAKEDVSEAAELARELIPQLEREFGSDDLATLHAREVLVLSLNELGDWEAAESAAREMLSVLEGERSRQIRLRLRAMQYLAHALEGQTRRTEARNLLDEVLRLQRESLGEDHPDVASTHETYGAVAHRLGDPEAAVEHLEQALAIRRKVFGEEHPLTLQAMFGLVLPLQTLDRDEEARAVLEEVLEIGGKALDQDHSILIEANNSLARQRELKEDLPAAVTALRRALSGAERAFGPLHSRTLKILRNLSNMLAAAGDNEEALVQAREVRARAIELAAAPDPDPMQIANNVWFLALCQAPGCRDHALAAELGERAVSLGGGRLYYPFVALSEAYLGLGDLDRAIQTQAKAVALPDALHHIGEERYLVGLYSRAGDLEGAEAFLREHLQRRRKSLEADSPSIGATLHQLGRVLLRRSRLDEAERHCLDALEQYRLTLEEDDPLIAWLKSELGELYRQTGRLDRARSTLVEAWSAVEPRIGRDQRETVRIALMAARLAEVHRDLGQEEEARQWQERSDALGEGEP